LVLVSVDSARLGMLAVNLLHTMYNCELYYKIKIFPFDIDFLENTTSPRLLWSTLLFFSPDNVTVGCVG
jgi:hypothetical protein